MKTIDGSHAEEGILNNLGPNELVEFGASSRGLCWARCHPRIGGSPDMVIGRPNFPSVNARNSPKRMFWRESMTGTVSAATSVPSLLERRLILVMANVVIAE
ncbi:hypothetical protein [Dactylosporangium salmoneum]|uniref:Uncharacterized protein n=1 Tax=Dactylosporangium salmoneum TaxID=53361 RepID=A0ABN3G1Y2_9ACTN